jgi:membrane associated rhomboid family serine protease
MGHLRFLLFYVLTGLAAGLGHVLTAAGSTVPMVGASGAISGIMGAYVVLYPRARIHTLFWFLIFIRVIPLPAWVILGYWMLIQVLSSAASSAAGPGVAYMAHIGGFVAGAVLIFVFRNPKLVSAKRSGVKLSPSQIDHGGWW